MSVGCADGFADFEFARAQPSTLFAVEGVVGCGDDQFIADGQVSDFVVGVDVDGGDGVGIDFACFFIICQNVIADFEFADGD